MSSIEELGKFVDLQTSRTSDGILLSNNTLGTSIKITDKALKENNIETIMMCLDQGKKVSQITRVTGYLSVVDNWGHGKVAELKDRHRVGKYFTA
jgi:anaerobic ribonucleoside-triphosphate reductase